MNYCEKNIKNMLAILIKSLGNNSRIIDKKRSEIRKILLIPGTSEYTYYKDFDVMHENCVINKIVMENPEKYVTTADKHELEAKLEKMLGNAVIELSGNEKIKSSDVKRKASEIETCLLEKPGPISFIFKLKNIKVEKTISVYDDKILICSLDVFKEKMNFVYDDLKGLFYKDDVILAVQVNERDNLHSYNTAKNMAQKIVNLINFVDGVERGPYVELKNIKFINTEKSIYYLVKNEGIKDEDDYIWKLSETLEAGLDGWNPPYNLTDRFEKWADLIPIIVNPTDNNEEIDLKEKVLTSINWLGRALADENLTDAFLKMMIAIEMICELPERRLENDLKKEEMFRGDLSKYPTKISAQIASIISYISNCDSVYVKDMYELRSRIVHDGKVLKSDQYNDFVRLFKYVQNMVEKLLFDEKYKEIHTTYELWKIANQL